MSKEAIKMVDEFDLPLKWDEDLPEDEVKVFDCTGVKAEYAVHAVNSHDALVQHNAELTKALRDVCAVLSATPVLTSDQHVVLNKARAALSKEQGQ